MLEPFIRTSCEFIFTSTNESGTNAMRPISPRVVISISPRFVCPFFNSLCYSGDIYNISLCEIDVPLKSVPLIKGIPLDKNSFCLGYLEL